MKKVQVWGAVLAAMVCGAANAADLGAPAPAAPAPAAVGPWDFAIGAAITSNYLFRGISQSNNAPSVSANAEIRYNINPTFQLYLGAAGASIKLTNVDASPSLELDIFGGLRASVGDFSADFGAIAYTYHGLGPRLLFPPIFPTNPTFFEGYVKLGYKVNDWLNIGANAFYTPSFLDTGAEAAYIAATAKITLPHNFAVSGEFGRQIFMGRNDLAHFLIKQPSYNYWNAGLSYTYKFATLDLRYHGTDLSKFNCNLITGPTNVALAPSSKYCGSTFVGTLSFALEGKDIK